VEVFFPTLALSSNPSTRYGEEFAHIEGFTTSAFLRKVLVGGGGRYFTLFLWCSSIGKQEKSSRRSALKSSDVCRGALFKHELPEEKCLTFIF